MFSKESWEHLAVLLNRWALIKLGLARKPCKEKEPEAEISGASELAFVSFGLWTVPAGNRAEKECVRREEMGVKGGWIPSLGAGELLVYCISRILTVWICKDDVYSKSVISFGGNKNHDKWESAVRLCVSWQQHAGWRADFLELTEV